MSSSFASFNDTCHHYWAHTSLHSYICGRCCKQSQRVNKVGSVVSSFERLLLLLNAVKEKDKQINNKHLLQDSKTEQDLLTSLPLGRKCQWWEWAWRGWWPPRLPCSPKVSHYASRAALRPSDWLRGQTGWTRAASRPVMDWFSYVGRWAARCRPLDKCLRLKF